MTRLGAGLVLVDGDLVAADVDVVDGRVAALTEPTRASRLIAAPGFVDLQVNGYAGVDFATCSADDVGRAAAELWACGITAFHPTLISGPIDATCAALDVIGEAQLANSTSGRAIVRGAHLEGPFLAETRLGTHNAAHRLDPDLEVLEKLLGAGAGLGIGPVSRMTLAPELDGALDVTAVLDERLVAVSAGHSNATAEQAHRGFDAGINSVTHLGNAMAPFHQRSPGLFGAALVREDVIPTVIADGAHLADDTIRLIFAATNGRVALVSDAVAVAGTTSASGRLGDVPVTSGYRAARNDEGRLAGGLVNLADMVRHVVGLGISPAMALSAASAHPRYLAGLTHHLGVFVNNIADLVLLDADLGVIEVIDAYA